MKRYLNLLSLASIVLAFCASLGACSENNENIPQSHQLTVNLNLKDELSIDNISSMQVIATNGKGKTQEIVMNGNTATVKLMQGQYKLIVSGKVKDEAAAYISGSTAVDLYTDAVVSINISKIVQSPIIYKAIYATGGKMGYMVDQYFELVNNSDEVQYLDGLILSSPSGKQKQANAWQANGYEGLYDSGQGVVVAFPGTGKDYPLQPGQSIVIANNAVNHKELAGEGNHCPDLSKADWEIYIDNIAGEIDYEAPNMDVIFQNNPYMKAFGLGFFGRAYLIARCPEGMTPQQFAADRANIMTTPGTTAKMEFLMIPSKYVLDAVDIWDNQSTEHYGTFLTKDDAQGVPASQAWEGMCVRRKVSKIENGRVYYQDTNNSSNDFISGQPLMPGKTPTAVDQ